MPLGEPRALDTGPVTLLSQVAMESLLRKQARAAECWSAFLVRIFNCGANES